MLPLRAHDESLRLAQGTDARAVTDLLVDAFGGDEMWGPWAFPGPRGRRAKRAAVFSILVDGALRYPWTWVTGDPSAAALWFPPGATELSAQQETDLTAVLADLAERESESVQRLETGFELIAAARPREEHYYLSLLGSAPLLAGEGLGVGLLKHTLELVDATGSPAYLEAADDLVPLYERFGFEVVEAFALPDGPTVNGMWRPALDQRAALRNPYDHGRSASGL